MIGLGALNIGIQQGIHHEIGFSRSPGLGNPTLIELAPPAPYLISNAVPINFIYNENGEVIGYIDENGNFVPLTDDDDTDTASE